MHFKSYQIDNHNDYMNGKNLKDAELSRCGSNNYYLDKNNDRLPYQALYKL